MHFSLFAHVLHATVHISLELCTSPTRSGDMYLYVHRHLLNSSGIQAHVASKLTLGECVGSAGTREQMNRWGVKL